MQKQELDTGYFLAIQATYEGIDLAIGEGDTVLESTSISKFDASRIILAVLEQLLQAQGATLSNIHFIIVNQGPGPFTTLRTVLATVNGLAFASGIPLVGVDGIATLATDHQQYPKTIVVALLNAFNQDIYYAIAQPNATLQVGCKNGPTLIQQLGERWLDANITFIGNGVLLLQADISGVFGSRALVATSTAHTASIEQIVRQGLSQWRERQNVATCLMPIYLKQHAAVLKHQ